MTWEKEKTAMTWEKEKTAMKDKGGKTPKEAICKHFELAQFHSLLMDLCEGQGVCSNFRSFSGLPQHLFSSGSLASSLHIPRVSSANEECVSGCACAQSRIFEELIISLMNIHFPQLSVKALASSPTHCFPQRGQHPQTDRALAIDLLFN